MSVYLKREDAPPDSEFEPGALHHLVAGNAGRVLDPRRTPITIVDIRPDTGTFVLRIDDFEDKLWYGRAAVNAAGLNGRQPLHLE